MSQPSQLAPGVLWKSGRKAEVLQFSHWWILVVDPLSKSFQVMTLRIFFMGGKQQYNK
jgi:hypothetical protein